MNVYFPTRNSLITIGSGFDTTVYSEEDAFLQEIAAYTQSQGLFFIRRD